MADAARKNAALTTVKVTPDLLLEIVNEQNRLRNAGEGKIAQSDIVHRAWQCYVESRTRKPGNSPVPQKGTKNVPSIALESSALTDISSDLSETEKVYLHKCLELLRSVVRNSFQKVIDALSGDTGLLNERPRPDPPPSDPDRKFDEAAERARDEIRGVREELHGNDLSAEGIPDRDRKGKKRPPKAG